MKIAINIKASQNPIRTEREANIMKRLFIVVMILVMISCLCSPGSSTEVTQPTQKYPSPTNTPETKVIFQCPDCEADLYIVMWQTPDEMGSDNNRVYHLNICTLLDQAISSEGIEKVKLACPYGTGWVRKESIQYY